MGGANPAYQGTQTCCDFDVVGGANPAYQGTKTCCDFDLVGGANPAYQGTQTCCEVTHLEVKGPILFVINKTIGLH